MSSLPVDAEPSVGIDLGTTNSAIATATQGGVRLIERKTGQRLMPSMVGALADGRRVVGEEARQLAEKDPAAVAYATKRLIGQRWSPELASRWRQSYPFAVVGGRAGDVRVKLAGQTLPVAQLSAMVLSELRADAEAWFDCEVHKAVITVPAAFTDTQRQATREAAAIAGLEVLRLVNEPTAAAMAYGLATGFCGNVVVFDLGGGTFDVSALSVKDGVFEVVATDGDPEFGGEDFDQAVVQWLLEQLPDAPTRERVRQSPRALAQLKAAAESAKIALSTLQRYPVALSLRLEDKGKAIPLVAELSRPTFEALVREKAAHCLTIVERTLEAARWAESEVESVLLVGGMTRAPLVRSLVATRFGRLPRATVNPDEAVALGAAVHAAELVEKRGGALLLDVVGSSLGVGVAGGLTQPLIPRNTMLPCQVQHTFFPSKHAQQVVRLPIVQGEERRTRRNVALGELVLDGLRGTTRDESAISVTFSLSQDGVLAVSAADAGTGRQKSLTLDARAGLSTAEAGRLAEREREHRAAAPRTPLDERARGAGGAAGAAAGGGGAQARASAADPARRRRPRRGGSGPGTGAGPAPGGGRAGRGVRYQGGGAGDGHRAARGAAQVQRCCARGRRLELRLGAAPRRGARRRADSGPRAVWIGCCAADSDCGGARAERWLGRVGCSQARDRRHAERQRGDRTSRRADRPDDDAWRERSERAGRHVERLDCSGRLIDRADHRFEASEREHLAHRSRDDLDGSERQVPKPSGVERAEPCGERAVNRSKERAKP